MAYPTETYYALGALWNRTDALARLVGAKLRTPGKPLPLLAADRAQVTELAAELQGPAARLADLFWPGPLTLVLPARPGLPFELTAGTGTVGVRIPGSALSRALAAAAGGAIVSTSANRAGDPPPLSPAGLDPALGALLDGILDGGPAPGGLPSTVLEVGEGSPRLLRGGAVSWEAIEAALARRQPVI